MRQCIAAGLLVVVAALLACASARADTWVWGAPTGIDRGQSLSGISCPSSTLCVASDAGGGIVFSRDPSVGSSAWTRTVVDPAGGGLTAISCPSSALCLAADAAGNLFASTDPASSAAGWTEQSIDPGGYLTGIACPTTTLCVATDKGQTIFTTTAPTGGASSWTDTTVRTGDFVACEKYQESNCASGLVGVSCPSAGLCVAMDQVGDALTTTTPARSGPWQRSVADPEASYAGLMTSISCPSISLCVTALMSGEGSVDVTTDPTAADVHWLHDQTRAGWAACPLALLCLASADTLSDDPRAGAPSWRTIHVNPGATLTGAACPSPSECLAVDQSGDAVVGTPARIPTHTGSRPRIIGEPRVGRTLRTTTGRWIGTAPIRFQHQWERCNPLCLPITDATSATLRVTQAERFWRLRVRVTASNIAGESARAWLSAQTRPVETSAGG